MVQDNGKDDIRIIVHYHLGSYFLQQTTLFIDSLDILLILLLIRVIALINSQRF